MQSSNLGSEGPSNLNSDQNTICALILSLEFPKVETKFKVNFVTRQLFLLLLTSEVKSKHSLVRESTTSTNRSNQSTGQTYYMHICHLLVVQGNIHKLVSLFPYSQLGNRVYLFHTATSNISCPEGSDRQREQRNNFHSFCVFPAINQIPSDIASFMDYCKNTETMCNDNVVKLQK